VRPSQSVEPNLPTKKTGRDKDEGPDTKEGSDEVGSWRTQDQDWSEVANALDKAKVDMEDRTGSFVRTQGSTEDNPFVPAPDQVWLVHILGWFVRVIDLELRVSSSKSPHSDVWRVSPLYSQQLCMCQSPTSTTETTGF